MSRSVLVRKISSHGLRGRYRFLALAPVTGGLALAMALPAAAATATPAAPAAPAARNAPAAPAAAAPKAAAQKITALPKSGIWTALSAGMTTEAPAPALWTAPNGVGWDVFPRQIGPNVFTYEAARVGTSGKVISGPADIFAAHWGSLEFPATLLGVGARPLLVFSGQRGTTGVYSRGCVYGALGGGTAKWALESWSLSANCVNPVAAAAESNAIANVLAAAWPGGWAGGNGVLYRIGLSTVIPAVPADQHIALAKATAGQTAVASDQAGNHHFYVGWTQVSSTPGSGTASTSGT